MYLKLKKVINNKKLGDVITLSDLGITNITPKVEKQLYRYGLITLTGKLHGLRHQYKHCTNDSLLLLSLDYIHDEGYSTTSSDIKYAQSHVSFSEICDWVNDRMNKQWIEENQKYINITDEYDLVQYLQERYEHNDLIIPWKTKTRYSIVDENIGKLNKERIKNRDYNGERGYIELKFITPLTGRKSLN